MSLKRWRTKINAVDEEIVNLLNARAELALQVKKEKQKKKLSTFVPEREKEVLKRVAKLNQGPLKARAMRQIYREILSSCRSLQERQKVAFLGPEATFTHQASLSLFGSGAAFQPEENIEQVFRKIASEAVDYGVVPIENSTEGAVTNTLDMFLRYDVKICAEIYLKITHLLLGTGKRDAVQKLFSNPQALAQCRHSIEKLLPSVEIIETASTSAAAKRAARSKHFAAIAAPLAAKIYRLKVLHRHIEDEPQNRTRFLVIGREESAPTGQGKTSILFSVPHRTGSLLKALSPLYDYKVNMTMIESRPVRLKVWEYLFFVDIEGFKHEARVKKALSAMQQKTTFLKVLGSYPEGKE